MTNLRDIGDPTFAPPDPGRVHKMAHVHELAFCHAPLDLVVEVLCRVPGDPPEDNPVIVKVHIITATVFGVDIIERSKRFLIPPGKVGGEVDPEPITHDSITAILWDRIRIEPEVIVIRIYD